MLDVKIAEKLRERHRLIRAGFTAQGTSLTAWCAREGVKRQNVDHALMQTWTGPKATQLVERVAKAAGVNL